MKQVLRFFPLVVALATLPAGTTAQSAKPGRPWFDAKIGVVFSSRLVRDAGASRIVGDSIPVDFASPVDVTLRPAPVITLSAGYPLRERSAVELSASYGLGRIVASDGRTEWDVQDAGMATAVVGLRHGLRPWLNLHGGLGATQYVSESRGLFAEGSDIQPLLEIGASTEFDLPVRVLLDARLQAHSFGTAALREDGADSGRIVRLLIQGGVRAGGSR